MATTKSESSTLEQIRFLFCSPTNLVTKTFPRIGYKGVEVVGFVSQKQLDKYARDTERIMGQHHVLFNSTRDNENLIYSITPVNGYGRPVD